MTKKLKLLKHTGSRTKWALVIAAIVASSVAAIAAVDVDGKFSLFDNAKWITGGPQPGEKAIDLTSDCNFVGTPLACDFSTLTDSGVTFTLKHGSSVKLTDISTLSADYNVGGSDCGKGAPRFSITFDKTPPYNNVFVYFGPYPNFTNCFFGWQNTGNVIASPQLIWDSTQFGGPFYGTHAQAVSNTAAFHITSISVVVDGGWGNQRGQDVTISHFTINDNVFPPKDQEGEEHWK